MKLKHLSMKGQNHGKTTLLPMKCTIFLEPNRLKLKKL